MKHPSNLLRGLAILALVGCAGAASLGSHTLVAQAASTPTLSVAAVGPGTQNFVSTITASSFDTTATVSGTGRMAVTMTSKGVTSDLYNGTFTLSSLAAIKHIKPLIRPAASLVGLSSAAVIGDVATIKFTAAGDATLQLACRTTNQ